ncbi:MAG: phosphoribosyltransferase family protein [Thermomicrobiales bacterium]
MIDELRGSGLLDDDDYDKFVRRGHVVYESGEHGDTWLELDLLFANPRRPRHAAARLAAHLRPYAPEVVCGPLVGGALVGQWVAYELDAAFVVAMPRPRDPAGPRYSISSVMRPVLHGKRVVVVDDVINAGAATLASVREVETWGGSVVRVGALIVRSPGAVDGWTGRGFAVEYLVGLSWETWAADDCPLCREGMRLDSPT